MRADIAIIGAGIAGASLAAELAAHASVILIEGESQPGYHSTGRSAAFWSETYGGPAIQPLTSASGPWLSTHGFLGKRTGLHIADAAGRAELDRLQQAFIRQVRLVPVDRPELERLLPGIAPGWDVALAEPTCTDIDVAALHAFYLAAALRAGTTLVCDAEVHAITRTRDLWRIEGRGEVVEASVIVNAAGAWAGPVARLAGATPIAITPYRRTIVQVRVDPPAPADLPLVMDAAERFYFKPEAGGRLWLSPHDETFTEPGDAAPEEIDVATAIDWIERLTNWRVLARERAWAGLRSFAPDRAPVYGFDAQAPGFFWFAGQGGFGIQTAPAAAALAAALLLDRAMPEMVAGIDAARYAPTRFAR